MSFTHLSTGNIIESLQQLNNCALATPTRTHESKCLPHLHLQTEVLHHLQVHGTDTADTLTTMQHIVQDTACMCAGYCMSASVILAHSCMYTVCTCTHTYTHCTHSVHTVSAHTCSLIHSLEYQAWLGRRSGHCWIQWRYQTCQVWCLHQSSSQSQVAVENNEHDLVQHSHGLLRTKTIELAPSRVSKACQPIMYNKHWIQTW